MLKNNFEVSWKMAFLKTKKNPYNIVFLALLINPELWSPKDSISLNIDNFAFSLSRHKTGSNMFCSIFTCTLTEHWDLQVLSRGLDITLPTPFFSHRIWFNLQINRPLFVWFFKDLKASIFQVSYLITTFE